MTSSVRQKEISPTLGTRVRAHISIARVDHWTKNVFVLPGVVIPLTLHPEFSASLLLRFLVGMISVCLISSSNYVLNELLDAPFDRLHPTKHNRPAAVGLVNVRAGYAQWLLLMAVGMVTATYVSGFFAASVGMLWVMGCVYNIRPIRTKDVPYLDVLSESVNNPLRMFAGWFIASDHLIPPVSLLASYWMVGAYFMALKRFSELREIGLAAASYRRSFRYYSERSLMVSVVFYASAAMLFFGAFLIRYRMELILSFPLVALVMAVYCNLAFDKNSAAQHPEYLYKHKMLMLSVVVCCVVMLSLLVCDIPFLYQVFTPTLPSRF